MRAVDRVAGLERDDALPAAVGERRRDSLGGQQAALERLFVVGQRVGLDRAGEAAVALSVDRRHPGMGVLGRAVDELGLALHVAVEDLLDGEPAERLAVVGAQLDLVARERHRGRSRGRPGSTRSRRRASVIDSTTERQSSEPMNPLERGEAAVREQLEVRRLTGAQRQGQGLLGLRHWAAGGPDVELARSRAPATRSGASTVQPALRLVGVGPAAVARARPRFRADACSACSRSRDSRRHAGGCRARRCSLM